MVRAAKNAQVLAEVGLTGSYAEFTQRRFESRQNGRAMFTISLRHDSETRRYSLHASPGSGWVIVREQDRREIRKHYEDWHRVERALAAVRSEVLELEARGWQVAGDAAKAS